jgi:hypothetical protein
VIRRRSRAELLLELVALVVVALLIRAHQAPHADGAPVSLAFFQFIIAAIVEVAKWIADEASTLAVVRLERPEDRRLDARQHRAGRRSRRGEAVGVLSELLQRNVLKPFVRWAWKEILRLHAWLAKELEARFCASTRATHVDPKGVRQMAASDLRDHRRHPCDPPAAR